MKQPIKMIVLSLMLAFLTNCHACFGGVKEPFKEIIHSANSFLYNFQSDSSNSDCGLPPWALRDFVRPAKGNPIIEPDIKSEFYCPMKKGSVKWEESDTFNPAAVVKDGKVYVLYRAEDNSAKGIGLRTSRIALAESKDGVKFKKDPAPVLFPCEDNMKQIEWPGGCEDPRVVMAEDGTYVMSYHAWDRKLSRLCMATSKDLKNWVKHGHVFEKAYDGRFTTMWTKATSIVAKVVNDQLVATKINGKYFMYWGENSVYGATSDDLINWTPILDGEKNLKVMFKPRDGFFDSQLTECGPPAVLTENGIILIYNGKNSTGENRDKRFFPGTYCAGQALFDAKDPEKLIDRLNVPFFKPETDYEKSGQYVEGTVFVEGLAYFKKKWFLYYGCADSKVAVAIFDPLQKND